MPRIPVPSKVIRGFQYVLENDFTGGLKTEFTGLNFPENACTSTENCTFFHTGAVFRRNGFDYEINNTTVNINRTNTAISTFVWTNVGGDGNTKMYVLQIGGTLYFYQITNATVLNPLSTTKITSTVNLSTFTSSGPTIPDTECQYAAGNGYLFVFHPGIIPIYCSYSTILGVTANPITVQIRDFLVYPDGSLNFSTRPVSSNAQHQYNLFNQGWPVSAENTFRTDVGSYPSNADQWWSFKNSTGVFNPVNTAANVVLGNSPAPRGYFIYDARNITRSTQVGLSLINTTTNISYRTGTWFAGRVWYTGLDASTTADPNGSYVWSENIYFSQIASDASKFGFCYQVNDPTSETFFDLLPSDGGVITIQGCGAIYKLFPITNGLLVFAANGVWFITGSTGIGFTATDYTVSKLSAIQSISSTSYIDVLGYPIFWNEEGIYGVSLEAQQQGLAINSLTLNTIKQFYDAIPKQSKKFARGSYNPITGQVQWLYRNTNETDITSRYEFDSMLTLSMFTQAFYPWQFTGPPHIHDVTYIVGPGGSTSPFPVFKYLTSNLVAGNYQFTFSEERDNVNWKDWNSTGAPVDYTSFFVTGYKLHGDAKRKFQPMYVFMYSDNVQNTAYKFNGKWNFAINPNSGKYSTEQVIYNTVNTNNFSKLYRRHRLRGRGTVLQLQLASVSGKPFHIDGWAIEENQASGV